jgi:hypothetical protein
MRCRFSVPSTENYESKQGVVSGTGAAVLEGLMSSRFSVP